MAVHRVQVSGYITIPKGDLLQRVIDDVASEAANAAEMKAASRNPLILMQDQIASDLRKLEAFYFQHQRSQHRIRDRMKWLVSAEESLMKAEKGYAANIKLQNDNTHIFKDKWKEKIKLELRIEDKVLQVNDNEKKKDHLLEGLKEITRNSSVHYN